MVGGSRRVDGGDSGDEPIPDGGDAVCDSTRDAGILKTANLGTPRLSLLPYNKITTAMDFSSFSSSSI